MTTMTHEEELLELIDEQLKDMDRGSFQPPEEFVVMSLDSYGYHSEGGIPPLRPYRERKKGCAIHGYLHAGLDKRQRFFCTECAREKARERMRKLRLDPEFRERDRERVRTRERRLRAQRKGEEVSSGSVLGGPTG